MELHQLDRAPVSPQHPRIKLSHDQDGAEFRYIQISAPGVARVWKQLAGGDTAVVAFNMHFQIVPGADSMAAGSGASLLHAPERIENSARIRCSLRTRIIHDGSWRDC
jgi:hypothetical protein